MSQYVDDATPSEPIESHTQLIDFFATAGKPREQWRIGTEYEKVVVLAEDGRAAPFSGPRGIERLLRELAQRYAWTPIEEDARTVALRGAGARITLEPGGQLELSGELCESVHCNQKELTRHIDEIVAVGSELGLAFLGLGAQPISRLDEIEWVPKRRYGIMGPYMKKVGRLGQRMMKQTAGVQVNLDYADEADAMMKVRTGMGLTPLITAIFANSPLTDGGLNGYLSYRGHIWTDTDPARCGILGFVFEPGASFEQYVDHALDVPMYFIVRDGRWFDMTSLTFREFWKHGHQGHRATIDDWTSHLTTLFYEVRLKKYLEIRAPDSQSPERMLAIPALLEGIFYDSDCLLAAWDLVKGWTWDERMQRYHGAHQEALRLSLGRYSMAELARELLEIATIGLRRLERRNARGEDESIYLEPIRDLVHRGRCPAEEVIEKWNGTWEQEPRRLVAGSSYRVAA